MRGPGRALQARVEIVFGDEIFERDIFEGGEVGLLKTHHDGATSSRWNEVERRQYYRDSRPYTSAQKNRRDFFNTLVGYRATTGLLGQDTEKDHQFYSPTRMQQSAAGKRPALRAEQPLYFQATC